MGNCISNSGAARIPGDHRSDGYESDVDTKRGASTSARTSYPNESLRGLAPIAKTVYKQSVLLHGTAQEHVPSLRRNGFIKDLKKKGATGGGTENFLMNFSTGGVSASGEHHYLTSDKKMAKDFAMYADSERPALVRTIGVANNFNLETDPYTGDPALRTRDSIPPAHVLGSKHSRPGDNAAVFRDEMQKAGHDVTTKQAGLLLREVQSDSDNDTFPTADDFIVAMLSGERNR